MRVLGKIPVLTYVLILYNLLLLLGGSFGISLDSPLFTLVLLSGASLTPDVGDLLIVLGILALAIEVVKATRSSVASVVDHALSTLVLVLFLLEFLLVEAAGTTTFLLLTLLALLDVLTGFTVTIATARRDVAVDRLPLE